MSINSAKIKQGERHMYVQLSPHKFVLYSIWNKNATSIPGGKTLHYASSSS